MVSSGVDDVGSGISAWWIFPPYHMGVSTCGARELGLGAAEGGHSTGFRSICEEPGLSPCLRVGGMGHRPAPSPAGLSWALPKFYFCVFLLPLTSLTTHSTLLLLSIYYL